MSGAFLYSVQNRNDFAVTVHLLREGNEEEVSEIAVGGNVVFYQIKKDAVYTIGIHADVDEGTEIKLAAYDGEWSEP